MKSYNILLVSHLFPPYSKGGGQSQVARDYAKGLSGKRYKISVIAHLFQGLKKEENIDGIDVIRFPPISKILFKIGLIYPKGLSQWLEHNIKNYDIVFIHGIYTLYEFIVAKICKKYGIPYIVMPHGVGNISKHREKVLLKRVFAFLFSNFVSKNAKEIIFCSNNEKNDYELPYKHGVVITNGINQDSWNESLGSITDEDIKSFRKKFNLGNKKIIFSMGTLNYGKRFDKVINYLSDFLKENPDYILLIVGPDGGEFKNLSKQIKENGLEKNIKIILGLYDKDKATIFKISDLFILASDHEGFPIVICEAISAKIPCLISNECNVSGFEGFVEVFNSEREFKVKFSLLIKKENNINDAYINSFDIKNSINSLNSEISKILD